MGGAHVSSFLLRSRSDWTRQRWAIWLRRVLGSASQLRHSPGVSPVFPRVNQSTFFDWYPLPLRNS